MLFRPYSDPSADAFDVLWRTSPRRQGGKLEAERAYRTALQYATAAEIQAGMEAYARYIRAHGIEERYVVNVVTWLKQGRWSDEYDMPEVRPAKVECPHEPRCNSPVWCQVLRAKQGEAV